MAKALFVGATVVGGGAMLLCMLLLSPAGQSAFLPATSVPWLSEVSRPDLVAELRGIADGDDIGEFVPDWQGLTEGAAADWSAITLLNKGHLNADGCARAPVTCATFGSLLARGSPESGIQKEHLRR